MDIFVINLHRRTDRREHIEKVLEGKKFNFFTAVDGYQFNTPDLYGFKVFNRWIDPLSNRKITRGEIGTSISHFMLWEKIASGTEPALILEDDNILINVLDLEKIKSYMDDFDILYLNYKEMVPEKVKQSHIDNIILPYYPYWTNSYCITPRFAKELASGIFKSNIIPVDEYLPILNDVDYSTDCLSSDTEIKGNFNYLKSLFFKNNSKFGALKDPIFQQLNRSVLGTDVEDIIRPVLHCVTYGTDEDQMEVLHTTSKKFNINFDNPGRNIKWDGGDIANGPGGGQKLLGIRPFLNKKEIFDDDVILFCDAYDVLINDYSEEILKRFLEFDCDVLFAGEKICWPEKALENKFSAHTPYKFLNSGCYIGYKWAIRELISDDLNSFDDDQYYLQKKYLDTLENKNLKVRIDSENYLFQCMSGAASSVKLLKNKQILNIETQSCPVILHGNGGEFDKGQFKNVFNKLYIHNLLVPNTSYLKKIDTDILCADFLSKDQCKILVNLAKENSEWKSLKYDKFPAQELRIKEIDLDLFSSIESYLMQKIAPHLEKYWFPLQMYGIRDMFIIKYTPDTQSSLNCHHDASLVSGIIKLNDDYEGGDTFFHRQDFSNKDVPVGNIILWPGQVTHGHEGRPVTSGTKYNLVIWTSRFPGDVNE